MDRQWLRCICDELWPAEARISSAFVVWHGDMVTSPPVRQTIAEIEVPTVFVYGVIDLMFAT
jgi:hypothetical protein